jgi:phage N-6-adenine-methyltransferase
MHNKPEPDTTADHALRRASPPLGGAAQRGAPIEQPQLFATPQTSRTSDDYYTPKWLFDALGLTFDLDVACPPEGPMHTPCKAFYTQEDDGLTQPWHGRVFMNPPFSKPQPWVHKFMSHANGVALLPIAKSQWFNQLWIDAHSITILPSSMKFVDPNGGNGSILMPTCVVAYNADNVAALCKIGHVR